MTRARPRRSERPPKRPGSEPPTFERAATTAWDADPYRDPGREAPSGPEPGPPDDGGGADPFELAAFVSAHWPWIGLVVALAASPGLYAALATSLPAGALFASSLAMLAAFIFGTVAFWPLGSYITWRRRSEVFGYRAVVAAGAYLVLGLFVILAINQFSPRTIPAEWPEARRFIPFWPFYTWFVLGCEGPLPCPPPP